MENMKTDGGAGGADAGNTGALSGIVRYFNDDSKDDGSKHCFVLISPSPDESSDGTDITDGNRGAERNDRANRTGRIGMVCSVARAELHVENIADCLNAVKKIADAESNAGRNGCGGAKEDAGKGTGGYGGRNAGNIYIICLNADCIAGYPHIESAVFHARRSWFEDKPIANSFEMEVLLYTAARRQCNEIGEFGLHKGNNDLFVCICREIPGKEVEVSGREISRSGDSGRDAIKRFFEENEKIFSGLERCVGLKLKGNGQTAATADANGNASGNANDNANGNANGKKLRKLMKLFDIPQEELSETGAERIEELVLEKVALLDIMK